MNHPFTAPREEDLHMLESDPGKVLAKAYDVILNGWELGGGSIRIHDRETQAKVFRLLGMSRRGGARTASASSSRRSSTARRRTAAWRSASIASCALLAGESVDPRSDPVPEDDAGRGPDVRRAVDRSIARQLRELHIRTEA